MKLESDKRVVCDGSVSECLRRLRLYIFDAVDRGSISAWRTWLGSRIALPNSSSLSAMLHSSSNVSRSSWQYPWRRARSSTESMRLRSGALVRACGVCQTSDDGGPVYVLQSVVVQSASP